MQLSYKYTVNEFGQLCFNNWIVEGYTGFGACILLPF